MTQTQDRALVQTGPQTVVDVRERDRLLRQLILPKASPEQFSLVLAICQRYGFDPLLRHVLIVGGNLYVTRDGLRHMAWQSGEFDGYDPPEERQDQDGKWVVTVKVWRKGIGRPFVATAYQREAENTASPVWRSHPRLMTGKVAEVIALRMAFGVSLSGAEEIGFEESTEQTNVGTARFVEAKAEERPATRRAAPPAQLVPPVDEAPAAGPGLSHKDFGDLLASLHQMDTDGVATKEIADFADAQWETLDAAQQERVLADLRQIKRARKAAAANRAAPPAAPIEAEVVAAVPARTVQVEGDGWEDVVGAPEAAAEPLTWTDFWAWARNSGFKDRAAVDAALGQSTQGMAPGEIQAALIAKLGPTWDAEREAAESGPFAQGQPAGYAG
jgi:hypothetical protein